MKSRSIKRRSSKRSNKRSVKRRSSKRSNKRSNRGCSGGKLKLISIKKSPNKEKKLRATFCTKQGRIKNVDFGAAGYKNYCGPKGKGKDCHNDKERRKRYLSRHKSRENFNKPDTPGSLSAHILWGTGSVRENIGSFKRRFNL